MPAGIGSAAALEPERPVAAVRAASPAQRHGGVQPRPRPDRRSTCPELDGIRDRLPPGVLAAAERRAADLGVGGDSVVAVAGLVSDDDYAKALARNLGVAFETLEGVRRADCGLGDADLVRAAATGLLPVWRHGELSFVVTPRGAGARRLMSVARSSDFARRICITSPARLHAFVAREGRRALARHAVESLRTWRPEFSASHRHAGLRCAGVAVLAALAAAACLAPAAAAAGAGAVLALLFLAWVGLRLVTAFTDDVAPERQPRCPERRLPLYSIIVALYREAAVVPRLIAALDALDYPPEKLDILIVVEADDGKTQDALAALRLRPPYTIIVAPPGAPRTKPKALNAALPFARGDFTAVYDAEDRPGPGQLRAALHLFRQRGPRLACAQARLVVENVADSLLTRLFAAEYSGLFDVFLPGLAARGLPLPLGGSSNHFRTCVLRELGAWDPFNVTEDADLGTRLARFGYATDVIASATQEEAPRRLGPWLRQRSRWFKGWMQTWIVHSARPLTLWRELGPAGFATFQLVIGGTVLAALIHPLFLATLALGGLLGAENDIAGALLKGSQVTALAAGYLASVWLGLLGLKRRGLLSVAWVLLAVPYLWLLLSLAAWRALWQFVRDPYRWDKTEHGLAREPRIAAGRAPQR